MQISKKHLSEKAWEVLGLDSLRYRRSKRAWYCGGYRLGRNIVEAFNNLDNWDTYKIEEEKINPSLELFYINVLTGERRNSD